MRGNTAVNNIKMFLNDVLSEYAPSFFLLAGSGFPRLVYELKQLYTDEQYNKYLLTINIYDINTTERIDDIADKIYANISRATYTQGNRHYKFYNNSDRQYINESDKTIFRIMMTLELRVYTRKDD